MLGRVGGRQELSIGQWCDYEHTVRNFVAIRYMILYIIDLDSKKSFKLKYLMAMINKS